MSSFKSFSHSWAFSDALGHSIN